MNPSLAKKINNAVPFPCFSAETGQDTMKEVQGASNAENTSLKAVKTILNTVVSEYADYPGHIFSNEASEKISEKTLRVWEVRKPDSDKKEEEMCPPSRKLRRAAELYGNKD